MTMVLATFGFAGSAMAEDKKPYEELLNYIYGVDEIDKDKEHKGDKKVMYTSLGVLGDVLVTCPGINQIQNVTVYDQSGGEVAKVQFYTPGKDNPDGDVNIPFPVGLNEDLFIPEEDGGPGDPDWCIGGTIATLDEDWNADGDNWDIWIRDQVWDTLDSGHPADLDFKTAGLARMVAEWETNAQDKKDTDPGTDIITNPQAGDSFCVLNDPTLDVCLQFEVGSTSHSQNFNQFGFCGQGYAEGLEDPFDAPNDPSITPDVAKVVFIDGVALYQFDCANEELTGNVGPNYNFVVGEINAVTCETLDLVCFFDFPVDPSSCFQDKAGIDEGKNPLNIAVPGIFGTIGWSHDQADKCPEQNVRLVQDVNTFEPGIFGTGYNVVVKGDGDLGLESDDPFVEIEYKHGDPDVIFYPDV